MEITEGIFNSFYAEEKIIDSDIVWKRKGDAYHTDHIPIISQVIVDYPVTLVCKVDRYNKYSFNIIYRKCQTLVRFDKKIHPPSFIDKCSGEKLDEPHKHKFKKGCIKDLQARTIPRKEIDREDVNKALGQFLSECNVRLEGEVSTILLTAHGLTQTRLFQYVNSSLNHIKREQGR